MASKNEQKIQEIVDAMAVPGIISTGAGNEITGNQIASTIRSIPKKTALTQTIGTRELKITGAPGYYPNEVWRIINVFNGRTIYTPTNANQTIYIKNYYLNSNLTIQGDANLIPANIKNGVSIFGVNGTYTGTQNPIPYVIGSIKSLSPASIIYYNTTDNYNVFYSIMQYAENTNEKVPLHSLLVYASANSTAPPYYTGLNLLNSSAQSAPRIFVFEVTSDFRIEG